MQIVVNGADYTVDVGLSVEALVSRLRLNPEGIAVAVNGEVVPRTAHAEQALSPGDSVEIIQAVGGG